MVFMYKCQVVSADGWTAGGMNQTNKQTTEQRKNNEY